MLIFSMDATRYSFCYLRPVPGFSPRGWVGRERGTRLALGNGYGYGGYGQLILINLSFLFAFTHALSLLFSFSTGRR